MKVAFLLGSLNRGGTETLLLNILDYQRLAQFDMVIIYRKEGDMSRLFHSKAKHVHKIAYHRSWMLWYFILKLRKTLKNENVNIIHTHQRLDTIFTWIASIGLPVKLVQTIHDFDFHYNKLGKILIHLSFKLSNFNVFVSNFQQKYYRSAYKLVTKSIMSVIYNGIVFKDFDFNNQQTLRKQFGIGEKSILLGTVGNFNAGRDQMTICRFLRLLKKTGIDYKFLFIGKKDESNPQYYNNCLSFCEDNSLLSEIIFIGPQSCVISFLPQFDAIIYSSDHDTFGMAVIEAIASGIPVFVNDWDVMKEITENGERAVLYQSKNEQDLLEKFMRFYFEPKGFIEKAKVNAKWVKCNYNIQRHISHLNFMYTNLIQ